jgi:hypothetical protein
VVEFRLIAETNPGHAEDGRNAGIAGSDALGVTVCGFSLAVRLDDDLIWSKISNALKRLGFRSHNLLAQLLSGKPQEQVQSGFDDQV